MKALIILLAAFAPTAVQGQDLHIKNVRVFDGATVRAATDVVVTGGRISALGKALMAPAGATVVDGTGKTLMPGFIDSHTHAFGDVLREAVVFGVTTELDMFSLPDATRVLREEQKAGKANDRADIFSAGVLVTAPGGHGTEYGFPIPTITSPNSAQAFVDARIAEGSDYIKLVYDDGALFGIKWATLSPETMKAVITAAHKRGKLATVHVSTLAGARTAIDAGADGLVHLFTDAAPTASFIALMKGRKAFAIPTLVVLKSITGVGGGAPLVDDARLQPFLAPPSRAALSAGFPLNPTAPPKDFAHALATVRQLKAAGVTILAGTDAPNPGTSHGAAMHQELALLVEAGLTPLQALTAATSTPAQTFGLKDRGRIGAGMRADLILVNGDPTTDIAATRAIDAVWKGGHRIDRETYARGVAAAIAAANAPVSGLEQGVISGFENGFAANFGSAWMPSTDRFAGGTSTGEAVVIDGGANGTAKSLRISGDITTKAQFPWSGVMWSPKPQIMQPADLSSKKEIRFWTKGDGGTYRIMAFVQSRGMMPVEHSFATTAEWQEVVIPWTTFGFAGKGVMGIIFSGGPKAGPFSFQVDEVILR